MSGHEYWEQQAAGHALHALSASEESEFAGHVAGCDVCARSVDSLALTAAQLGAVAQDNVVRPPAWSAIRDAVLSDAVNGDRPRATRTSAAPSAMRGGRRSRRESMSRRVIAVAAGIAVLTAAIVATVRLDARSGTRGPLADCRALLGCHVISLRSSQTGGAAGDVIVAPDGDLTMVSTAMRPSPPGRTYVLWQVPRDGRPQAVDVFKSARSGGAAAGTLLLPYSDLLEFAISSEPANALPSKPSKILAVGATT